MSHYCDETYDVYKETRVTARKAHACEACLDPIPQGQTYWRIGVVLDREARAYKRCERCQVIHLHLRKQGDGNMWPAERLDCGEEYRDHWGREPPEHIAALAFALPGETKVAT